jgi:hypothetical protein
MPMFFLLQLLLISSLNNFLSFGEGLLPSLSPQVGRDFRVNYGGLRDFIVREMYTNKKSRMGRLHPIDLLAQMRVIELTDKRDHLMKCPRAETKTDCQVRMSVVMNRE